MLIIPTVVLCSFTFENDSGVALWEGLNSGSLSLWEATFTDNLCKRIIKSQIYISTIVSVLKITFIIKYTENVKIKCFPFVSVLTEVTFLTFMSLVFISSELLRLIVD